MPKLEKDKIRKTLIKKRSLLSKKEQKIKSERIISNIETSKILTQANTIAFYHAVRGEADPSMLMKHNDEGNNYYKSFYLPLLSSDKSKGLVFAPISKNTLYRKNAFSIPEPIVNSSDFLAPESLDLVIMPLLAFDLKGNRLGMGGGYYDRCFAFKQTISKKPFLLGFAYDFQQIEKIKSESWDIGLDAVVTESKIIRFDDL